MGQRKTTYDLVDSPDSLDDTPLEGRAVCYALRHQHVTDVLLGVCRSRPMPR